MPSTMMKYMNLLGHWSLTTTITTNRSKCTVLIKCNFLGQHKKKIWIKKKSMTNLSKCITRKIWVFMMIYVPWSKRDSIIPVLEFLSRFANTALLWQKEASDKSSKYDIYWCFRMNLARSTSSPSFEQRHLFGWKIFNSKRNDIALISMYITDTLC